MTTVVHTNISEIEASPHSVSTDLSRGEAKDSSIGEQSLTEDHSGDRLTTGSFSEPPALSTSKKSKKEPRTYARGSSFLLLPLLPAVSFRSLPLTQPSPPVDQPFTHSMQPDLPTDPSPTAPVPVQPVPPRRVVDLRVAAPTVMPPSVDLPEETPPGVPSPDPARASARNPSSRPAKSISPGSLSNESSPSTGTPLPIDGSQLALPSRSEQLTLSAPGGAAHAAPPGDPPGLQ